MLKKILIAGAMLLLPAVAQANGFEDFARAVGATIMTAQREDTNTYVVREYGTEYLVRTRYCYVYAYMENVVVHDGTLYFLDENESCEIEDIYRK